LNKVHCNTFLLGKLADILRKGTIEVDFLRDGQTLPLMESSLVHVRCHRTNNTILTDLEVSDADTVWQESSLLDAYILPEGMEWPTFSRLDDKQSDCVGRRVLFSRTALHCIGNEVETTKFLKNNDFVAWIGCPGIGKTASLNKMLMIQLKSIGRANEKEHVFLRINRKLIWFDASNNDGTVVARSIQCGTLESLRSIVDHLRIFLPYDKCVVLVELAEDEQDPQIPLPYFVTTSSRDVASITLKTCIKSKGKLFLSDPPTFPEVYFMREILSIVEPSSVAVPTLEDLRERVAQIGGILRYLFSDRETYLAYLEQVNSATNDFFKILDDMSIYNIPAKCKFFLAPAARKGIPNTDLGIGTWLQSEDGSFLKESGDLKSYIFKFHSTKLAQCIGSIVKNSDALNMIETYGLTYQVMERKVLEGAFLRNDPSSKVNPPSEWLLENWDIFKITRGNFTQYDNKKLRSATSRAMKLIKFPGMVLKKPAHELDEENVFQSAVVNGKVYDLLVVNHTMKRVYVFQVTSKTPKAHPIPVLAFEDMLKGLHMLDKSSESSKYKIVYVMVVPKKLSLTSITFKNPDGTVVNVTKAIENKLDTCLIAQMEF